MCFPNRVVGSFNSASNTFTTNSRPMSSVELATLKAEWSNDPTGRSYSGKTAIVIASLMNSGYLISNPVTQGHLSTLDKDTFVHQIMPIVVAAALGANAALASKYQGIIAYTMPMIAAVASVDLTNPLLQSLVNGMSADSLITSAQAAALLQPLDPSWSATVVQPPRSEVIFDLPLLVEPADVTLATGVN